MCLDKTGTVTEGNPGVTDIISPNDEELLSYAYALESKSEHPLSKAVIGYCEDKNIKLLECDDAKVLAGNGLCGTVNGVAVHGGNDKYIKTVCAVPAEYIESARRLSASGKTPLFLPQAAILSVLSAFRILLRQQVKRRFPLSKDGCIRCYDNG